MRKPPPILALMSRRATLLHGGISIRAWTSARLRSCHSNELRSLKFGHSVERFDGDSDFSRAAGTVARFEGLVNHPSCSFCSGTSPPRLLSAFCGQTPSANSFLNWNGRPARAPEAALSIVALPKGRIHERCPALVAPATAEYGTLNSEVKHFDKFCFGFSRLCTSGAPPVWDTGQCGLTPKPQRRGRDQGGRFSFMPPRCLAWVEAGEPLPAVTARTT